MAVGLERRLEMLSSLEAIRDDMTVFRAAVSSYPAESHRQLSFLMSQVHKLCNAYDCDREKMHRMLQQSLEAFQFQLMDVEKDNRRQKYEAERSRKAVSRVRGSLPELARSVHSLQPELYTLRSDLVKSLEEANALFVNFLRVVKSNPKLGSKPREKDKQERSQQTSACGNLHATADGPPCALLTDLNLQLQESQLQCKRAEFQVQDLRNSLEVKEKILQALTSDLEGLRKEHVQDLKKANEELFKSKMEVLENSAKQTGLEKECEALKAKTRDLGKAIETAEASNGALKEEILHHKKQNRDQSEVNSQLKSEVQILTHQLQQCTDEISREKQEKNRHKKQLEDLRKQSLADKEKLLAYESTISQYIATQQSMQDQIILMESKTKRYSSTDGSHEKPPRMEGALQSRAADHKIDDLRKHDFGAMNPFSDYIKEYKTVSSTKSKGTCQDQQAHRSLQSSDSSLVDFGSDADFRSSFGSVKASKRQKNRNERMGASAKGLTLSDLNSNEKFGRDRTNEIRQVIEADSLFSALGVHHPKRFRN